MRRSPSRRYRTYRGLATPLALAAIAIVTSVAACSQPLASSGDTHIRLRNASSFVLTDITFAPGTDPLHFPLLNPGDATDYRTVEAAYRYGYLEVLVGGVRRVLQPIDYVGESHIGVGRFTFVITVDPTTRQPATQLVKDN